MLLVFSKHEKNDQQQQKGDKTCEFIYKMLNLNDDDGDGDDAKVFNTS